jgi:aspartate/methionine/tyrosine aminotransferase
VPRFPQLAARSARISGSTFEKFLPRLRLHRDGFYKLHIGDSDRGPNYRLPYSKEFTATNPHAFQYANTFGITRLREAIAAKLGDENSLDVQSEDVLVTAGATNALSACVHAICDEGDEVLVLTPGWPFFRGMVQLAGGRVRELAFYTKVREVVTLDIEALVDAAVGDRTVAIYLNSPNNPSGVTLDREELSSVLRVAEKHRLWVISDEAYDQMAYDGRETLSPAALGIASAQILSTFTFSKTYRFAGLRLGWATGPRQLLSAMNKIMVHMLYGPTVPGQYMMLEALSTRQQWAPAVTAEYQGRRDDFIAALGLDMTPPEGTYFLFFDAHSYLGDGGIDELVGRCIDAGVAVTPGEDFGEDFREWIRVCFSSESPERAKEGALRLRRVLLGDS